MDIPIILLLIFWSKMKKILITGGTGSLGKALIARIKDLGWIPIVYSRDEGKQAIAFGKDKDVIRIIGDVRDLNKLNTSFSLHKPDYVIHAAALKRVDDMEMYPDECVKTNIQGSENVAIAACMDYNATMQLTTKTTTEHQYDRRQGTVRP